MRRPWSPTCLDVLVGDVLFQTIFRVNEMLPDSGSLIAFGTHSDWPKVITLVSPHLVTEPSCRAFFHALKALRAAPLQRTYSQSSLHQLRIRPRLCPHLFRLNMDARVYGRSCPNLLTESLSGTVTDPPPDAGQFISEFPLLDSEGQRINRWPLDIPSNIHNPQVNDEAGFFVSCWTCSLYQQADAGVQLYLASLRPSIQPTLVQGMDERVGRQAPHDENLTNNVHEEDIPVLRPLDPMRSSTAFSWFTEV